MLLTDREGPEYGNVMSYQQAISADHTKIVQIGELICHGDSKLSQHLVKIESKTKRIISSVIARVMIESKHFTTLFWPFWHPDPPQLQSQGPLSSLMRL